MREMSACWASQEKGEARQARQKRTASYLKECPLEQSPQGWNVQCLVSKSRDETPVLGEWQRNGPKMVWFSSGDCSP